MKNFNITPLGCSREICNTLLAVVGVDLSVYTTKEQIEFLEQNNIKMPVQTYVIPFTVKKQGVAHVKAISEYEAILKLEKGEFEKLLFNSEVSVYKYDESRDNECYLVEWVLEQYKIEWSEYDKRNIWSGYESNWWHSWWY